MSALFKVAQQHGESGQRVNTYLDFAWKWVNISSSVSITTADSYLMSEAHDKFVISGPNRN